MGSKWMANTPSDRAEIAVVQIHPDITKSVPNHGHRRAGSRDEMHMESDERIKTSLHSTKGTIRPILARKHSQRAFLRLLTYSKLKVHLSHERIGANGAER